MEFSEKKLMKHMAHGPVICCNYWLTMLLCSSSLCHVLAIVPPPPFDMLPIKRYWSGEGVRPQAFARELDWIRPAQQLRSDRSFYNTIHALDSRDKRYHILGDTYGKPEYKGESGNHFNMLSDNFHEVPDNHDYSKLYYQPLDNTYETAHFQGQHGNNYEPSEMNYGNYGSSENVYVPLEAYDGQLEGDYSQNDPSWEEDDWSYSDGARPPAEEGFEDSGSPKYWVLLPYKHIASEEYSVEEYPQDEERDTGWQPFDDLSEQSHIPNSDEIVMLDPESDWLGPEESDWLGEEDNLSEEEYGDSDEQSDYYSEDLSELEDWLNAPSHRFYLNQLLESLEENLVEQIREDQQEEMLLANTLERAEDIKDQLAQLEEQYASPVYYDT